MPAFGITARSCRCRFCPSQLEAGELRISTKEMMGRNMIEAHHHWMCYLKKGKFKDPEKIYGYDHLPAEMRDQVEAFVNELFAQQAAKHAAAKAVVAAAKAAEKAAAKAVNDAKKAAAKEAARIEKAAAKASIAAAKEAAKAAMHASKGLAGSKRPRSADEADEVATIVKSVQS
jgi:hypothetical protein